MEYSTINEVWKQIKDARLPDYYQISNFGNVRSLPYVDGRGWKRKLYNHTFKNAEITLRCLDGQARAFPVAQLALKTFVGPPGKGQYLARHLDDNRKNNHISNLAWGDDADNHADALRNGISFVSRGHLGKLHSEETKQKLRAKRLGKPTGRKMTTAHRAAIMAGYRNKFPEKTLIAKQCKCGCGELAKAGSKFIWGHAGSLRFKKITSDRIGKPRAW